MYEPKFKVGEEVYFWYPGELEPLFDAIKSLTIRVDEDLQITYYTKNRCFNEDEGSYNREDVVGMMREKKERYKEDRYQQYLRLKEEFEPTEKEKKCECGGAKTGLTHSFWCPAR